MFVFDRGRAPNDNFVGKVLEILEEYRAPRSRIYGKIDVRRPLSDYLDGLARAEVLYDIKNVLKIKDPDMPDLSKPVEAFIEALSKKSSGAQTY